MCTYVYMYIHMYIYIPLNIHIFHTYINIQWIPETFREHRQRTCERLANHCARPLGTLRLAPEDKYMYVTPTHTRRHIWKNSSTLSCNGIRCTLQYTCTHTDVLQHTPTHVDARGKLIGVMPAVGFASHCNTRIDLLQHT